MPSLLQRLKERKIVQWAVVYLAGAWLCLEALGFVADTFGWPTYITRSAIVLAAVGFFAVLVLAWYHGEKGRQKASGVELLILAGILVVAGVAVAAVGRGSQAGSASEDEVVQSALGKVSIAALPFVNRSGLEEDEYFTDGIHDEILTQLSKISGLSVRGRTSVMQYRDTQKNLRQIGDELNAHYILEGGVQRAGGTVRINLQLLDAESDEQIWAQTYDRPLTVENLLGVQSEVALQVAEALETTLTTEEAKRIEQRPTDNLEAYEYYLRGNLYYARTLSEGDARIALDMYERAIELDPRFTLAYAKLSQVHAWMYFLYHDRSEARCIRAEETATEALGLDPDLPDTHLALGYFYYRCRVDYERAIEHFRIAEESGSRDSHLFLGMASVRRRQGKMEEALESFQRAFEADPRSALLANEVAETYFWMRRYEEAEQWCEQTILLGPDWPYPYGLLARLYLSWEGHAGKARAILAQGSERIGITDDHTFRYAQLQVELLDRNYQDALQQLSEGPPGPMDDQLFFVPKVLAFAQIYGLVGNGQLESEYSDSARAVLAEKIRGLPEDARFRSALGIAYAGLGRNQDAIREGRLAVELMPVSEDALRGTWRVADLARIYTMVGEYDAAIDQLDYLLSIPGEISVPLLRIDPTWDPLGDHPRFQALLAKYE